MKGQEFAELSAFVEVAKARNFARAARALDIVPSTLSHTIRSLEERLNVRLFNRTTRSVALTQAGEKLLARLQPALTDLASAVESVNDFRDKPAGLLRLSLSSIPAQLILAPALASFMREYPAISLDVVVDDAATDLPGVFDAGIRYGRRIAQDMQVVRVFPKSRIVTLASPGYLAVRGVPKTPQDLADHECIRFRVGGGEILRWEFARRDERVQVDVQGSLIVGAVDLALRAAVDGIGIVYMVEAYAAPYLADGRLRQVLDQWSPPWDDYYLYYSSRRQVPAALRAFIQHLRKMHLGLPG